VCINVVLHITDESSRSIPESLHLLLFLGVAWEGRGQRKKKGFFALLGTSVGRRAEEETPPPIENI
jgi:hypothetical protein